MKAVGVWIGVGAIALTAMSAETAVGAGKNEGLEAALQVSRDANAKWTDCLQENLRRFEESGEAVETVVTATFGACGQHEGMVKDSYVPVYGLAHLSGTRTVTAAYADARKGAQEMFDARRQFLRERLVTSALEIRMQKKSERP